RRDGDRPAGGDRHPHRLCALYGHSAGAGARRLPGHRGLCAVHPVARRRRRDGPRGGLAAARGEELVIASLIDLVSAALLVVGALFTALAAVGIIRLPDLYTRMHAASKAGTVGSCLMLIALAVQAGDMSVALRAVVAVAFF